ncbi:TonB-dependent receptor [Alteromonas halophila]|uniref:TonB-dependent receptor n=1 Tax=Alteromonas halophila TaxID=516698 RepID=A0A918JMZ5_9ALTE|nr:TonB-dependent receptor [Alteromonas halophila]GGW89612.1 TonB-dependent receptor [Alteromonas halophila]
MTRQILRSGFTLMIIGVSLGGQADETSTSDVSLEHIEVRAQKSVQPLQSVPLAVTALDSDWIDRTVALDIFDTTAYVPGFAAMQNQSATNSSFSIRGIGTTAQNYGFESSVGLYVNGVYRRRQNALINDFIDIARIEILKGPQATLFGKNTPAGAVTLESRRPVHGERDGFVALTTGSDDLLRLSGAASHTLIDDALSVRAAGFTAQRDGYIDEQQSGVTLNNRDRSGATLQLYYTPTSDVSVRVIADYAELDERCCGALTWQDNRQARDIEGKLGTDALLMQPPFNATLYTRDDFYDYRTSLSQAPRSTLKDKGLSVQLDYTFSPLWSLRSITAHRSLDAYDRIDSDFSDARLLEATNDAQQHAFSQELQFHYQTDSHRGIVGAFYYSQNLDLTFDTTTQSQFPAFFRASASELVPLPEAINTLSGLSNGIIAPAAPATPADTAFKHTALQQQESLALFGQNDWSVTPALTLSTGLRYTREDKSLTARFTEQGPGISGLTVDRGAWPNPLAASQGLIQIAGALGSGQPPPSDALRDIAPFQRAGWGYYFLGSAAVLPRPDLDESMRDEQLTGSLKLAYQTNPDTLLYASLATGYKAGGINTDRIAPQFDPVFDAEKARTLELGIKRDWPSNALRTNIALYRTWVDDFQATTFTGSGFNLQNAGSIDVKGAELELTWLPWQHTEVQLAAARVLAQFSSFERGTCRIDYQWHTGLPDPGQSVSGLPYCSRSGDRVGFEPETTLSVTATRHFALGRFPGAVSLDYQYSGDVMLDDTNDPLKHAPSYSLVNLRLHLSLPEWNTYVTLWGRNIFDEDYVARSAFSVPVQTGKIMAYPGRPVSYGIDIHSRF